MTAFVLSDLFPAPPPSALINLTNNPHVSIPQMLDMFGERFRIYNWIIVFKGLITAHNLMTLGSEVRQHGDGKGGWQPFKCW